MQFDMLRKLCLVGFMVVTVPGSCFQIWVAAMLSVFFVAAHFYSWPYKLRADNILKAVVEVLICVTILVALMLKNPDAAEEQSFGAYEYVLITCYALVPIAFAVAMLSKTRATHRLFQHQEFSSGESPNVRLYQLYKRGLAQEADVQKLVELFKDAEDLAKAPPFLLPLLKRQKQSKWPPPLPHGCDYHFCILKDDNSSKESQVIELSENIAGTLLELHFTVWLSQFEVEQGRPINEAAVRDGIDKSMMVVLILSAGLFKGRKTVQSMVKHAIDTGKPILLLNSSLRLSLGSKLTTPSGGGCSHVRECGENVRAEFQPYARALPIALEAGGWAAGSLAGGVFGKQAAIQSIVLKLYQREEARQKLADAFEAERHVGVCRGVVGGCQPYDEANELSTELMCQVCPMLRPTHDLGLAKLLPRERCSALQLPKDTSMCQLCVQLLEQVGASGMQHDAIDGSAPTYLLDLLQAHQQSEWPPPLPQGCDYHLFISKHEATAKELSENIARELTKLGLNIWLSQSEAERGEPIDAAGMEAGVEKSAMLLLILTPGIFRRERKWVTHTEVKHAIDLGKPIQLISARNL